MTPLAHRLRCLTVIPAILAVCATLAQAEPVPVRQAQGTVRGFLELRSDDGRVVASGDYTQVSSRDRITTRTLFTFGDGSIDDETTVFTQRRNLQLVSDRHIQKGPSFPHPMDMLVDAGTGEVTIRTTGKDGKEDVKSEHLDLPPDIANGLIPVIVQNLKPSAADTTVSMVIATPKPRLVKLVISPRGEDTYTLAGLRRKAIHYSIKIDLGGIVGIIAPLIGKAPPEIEIWTIAGATATSSRTATTFARETGPLYAEGPRMTIQLASPAWPAEEKTAATTSGR